MKIKFAYNRDKALQVVLWFLKQHKGKIDKLKLIKLVFLSDQKHLLLYGRPIVGGTYYAMPHGPVSSELLDDLKSQTTDSLFTKNNNDVLDKGVCLDENFLSESDIEILKKVDNIYGSHDGWSLRNKTHILKCYQKNVLCKNEKRKLLPYEDFFLDADNQAMLDIIRDEQQAWADFKE